VLRFQLNVLHQHTPRAPGSTNPFPPGSGAPLFLTDVCEPHLHRGLIAPAEKSVGGTSMCLDCFFGRPVKRCEMVGDESYVQRGYKQKHRRRESWRRYYWANREEINAEKRRQRQLEKKGSPPSGTSP
jgi:hypothetical protein